MAHFEKLSFCSGVNVIGRKILTRLDSMFEVEFAKTFALCNELGQRQSMPTKYPLESRTA